MRDQGSQSKSGGYVRVRVVGDQGFRARVVECVRVRVGGHVRDQGSQGKGAGYVRVRVVGM